MHETCSFLGCGHDDDREFATEDYEGPVARWCAGCGDHSVLSAAQRLLAAEQLAPEQTMFVSGIGCSSRFPHYMKTYGFHGIHGRALPLATGIKLHRPDLKVFVVMGDGDCCSIGAAHWIHAVRYNVDMVALLLDNNIYGLTKNQTSPTTPQGLPSNTQPDGGYLPALNPLSVTLGVVNASFVAQTADWVPGHLFATLQAAYRHKGLSFVRILQRCPVWLPALFQDAVQQTDHTQLLVHERGIVAPDVEKVYKNHHAHDPTNLDEARRIAEDTSTIRLGLFYRNEALACYDDIRRVPARTADEKIAVLNSEFDRHAV